MITILKSAAIYYICAYKIKKMNFEDLKPLICHIFANKNTDETDKLHQICTLLEQNIAHYNWVGFYFRNGDKEELKLKTYVGAATDHTIIPFGKGICGQVALTNKNFVVPDVAAQDNYLSCSIAVKSEIVVPIIANGINIGQIDIDSNILDPFSEKDERFLEFVCAQVAELY